jgi:hypothetical protein
VITRKSRHFASLIKALCHIWGGYLLYRMLGGPQSQSGPSRKENILRFQELNLGHSTHSPFSTGHLHLNMPYIIHICPDQPHCNLLNSNAQGKKNWTPCPWSMSELHRPSDFRLLVKLVPTLADRRCHVVSARNLYSRILRFLDWSHYSFFQVAPQLYSQGWVDPIPDLLPLRKPGSAGNRTRISGSLAWNSDH